MSKMGKILDDISTDFFSKVIQYEVKQGEGEQVFDAAALEDGKITVEGTSHYIALHYTLKTRLHYIALGTGRLQSG